MKLQVKLLGTKEAAKRLGLTERRVRVFCEEGRLGTLVSGQWLITEAELRVFRLNPPGRPKGRRRKKRV
ncbi:MAG: hypothetical protein FD131_4421 [Rhodocyclaceae bacterium]|nr:MAG: hypothetical protein FD131_4421 [Rhodocyclaceae bacterium]